MVFSCVGGSSPRLWGTRGATRANKLLGRFIPTLVGNTIYILIKIFLITVHPHACGEHVIIYTCCVYEYGSSPRLWGTRIMHRNYGIVYRFIPTLVGNTTITVLTIVPLSVHPHACGEHGCGVLCCRMCIGSSPRLWGTLHTWRPLPHLLRFIPTLVGNTC